MSANHGNSRNDCHQTGDIYSNGNIGGYGNVDFSVNDDISESYQAQVLEDNSSQKCWDDHSNYVYSTFGLPDPEFIDPRWLVGPPIPMFAGQAFAFNSQENHPDDAFNHAAPQLPNCAHGPAAVIVGNYASSVSLPGSIPQTRPPMASPSVPPEMGLSSTPIHGHSTTPTEDKTDAVNLMLLDLRHAGKTYPEISRVIEKDLGVVIQPNALTKRYSKMEDVRMSVSGTEICPRSVQQRSFPADPRGCWQLLPVAIRNSMPES
jgi:hypothetical protein